MVKNQSANAGDITDADRSLGGEDPLEAGMTTHSSTFAWGIPWTEEPGSYSPWGHRESDATERLSAHAVTGRRTTYRTLMDWKFLKAKQSESVPFFTIHGLRSFGLGP